MIEQIRTDVVHRGCGGQVREKIYHLGGRGKGPAHRRCLKCGEEDGIFGRKLLLQRVMEPERVRV